MQQTRIERTPAGGTSISKLFVKPLGRITTKGEDETTGEPCAAFPWLRDALNSRSGALALVLGDFGHGKTTLLKVLAASSAKAWKANQPIPVFVPLRRYFETNHSLYDLVAETLAECVELTQKVWRENRWQIFCDGFDELNAIHQNRPDWVRGRFDRLYHASRSDNVSIVLSSRPILFMDSDLRIDYLRHFDRVFLEPFSEPQIAQWLKNNEDEMTLEEVKDRGLLEIAATPVILNLVSQLRQAGKLEERRYRRVDVYRQFFEWVGETGGALEEGEVLPKHGPIPIDVLRKIAVMLFSHEEAQAGMMWVPLLLHELEREGLAFDERLFVKHAFHEGKPDYIEFLHQSLMEYLVADHCFQAIFAQPGELGEFGPDFRAFLFERLLTAAELTFFREMVESMAMERDESLIRSMCEEHWNWPQTLSRLAYQLSEDVMAAGEDLVRGDEAAEETAMALAWRFYTRRLDNGEFDRICTTGSPHLTLANASLLVFLGRAYYLQACGQDDIDRCDDLSSLIRFLSSYNEFDPLLKLLRNALSGLTFGNPRWGFRSDIFKSFVFERNLFFAVRFENCTFEKTVFRECRFQEDSIVVRCQFRGCRFESGTLESVQFDSCWFDADCQFETKGEGAVFKNCIFRFESDRACRAWGGLGGLFLPPNESLTEGASATTNSGHPRASEAEFPTGRFQCQNVTPAPFLHKRITKIGGPQARGFLFQSYSYPLQRSREASRGSRNPRVQEPARSTAPGLEIRA